MFALHTAILEANLKGQPRGTQAVEKGAAPKPGTSKGQADPEEEEKDPQGPSSKKVSECGACFGAWPFRKASRVIVRVCKPPPPCS